MTTSELFILIAFSAILFQIRDKKNFKFNYTLFTNTKSIHFSNYLCFSTGFKKFHANYILIWFDITNKI